MSAHDGALARYLAVFAALLVLTGATIGAAYVDMGRWNNVVALAIAATKAALVVWVFMHVRESSRLTRVFAAAGFLWLLIFFALVFADFAMRSWMPIYGT